MKIRFNTEKVDELIEENGIKIGYVVKKLDTSRATFGRWMKEETPIPFVKAVHLADILGCSVTDLYTKK